MIKNYILITFRSMMKNKLFIFINVIGLGISIASCIVAYFNYDFNRTFDSIHVNASTIYRVNSIREFQNERRCSSSCLSCRLPTKFTIRSSSTLRMC